METSAVNHLADKYTWADAVATKGLQNTKGNIWYLSPVTLWEIMLTQDKTKREQIIFYCQHLFDERLIGSPTELIVNYINAGCPEIQKPYDFHSKLEIAEVWKDICKNPETTFEYDYEELKNRMKLFQKLSKQIDKIINRLVLDTSISDDELHIQMFINAYYESIKDDLKHSDPDYHKVIKISILFAFYILCLEGEIDNSPTKTYWKKFGISDSLDRLTFLMKMYKGLILRGPLYQMAIMAFHQISEGQKSNRGLYMDCLHVIYTTVIDRFITNDEHFKTLKEKGYFPNFLKVLHISEFVMTETKKKIHKPEK
jgi:hypothetical protein